MPERIGKYEILAEIGRGGFGCVYRAFDSTMGRPVAIKVLNAGDDKELLARFRNEAASAGNLHHENIVTIYEFGEHEGRPFIAMELLAGEDLQRILRAHKPLTLLEKVHIMSQVASGLDCAHRNGVVHRDVKPANIMVQPDGTVKIMDFGIARLTGESTRLTHHGYLVGTLMYMAPEQFTDVEADPPCDIFAYGIVFHEFLTGRHPFQAPDVSAAIRLLTSEDPPAIRKAVPECPPGLEAVLLRALEKDRELRYHTLQDLLFDLRPVQAELNRRRASELTTSARELYESGRLAVSQEALRQALELDANNADAVRLHETIQKKLQHEKIQPRIADLLRSGEEELGQRHFREAVQRFESALRLDTSDVRIRARLEHARAALEQSRKVATLIEQARRALLEKDITGAYRTLSEALAAEPENPEAAQLLRALHQEIERQEGERKLDDALNTARRCVVLEDFDEAIRVLEDLGEQLQSNEQVVQLLQRARVQKTERERRQRIEQAIQSAREALKRGRPEDAVHTLEEVAATAPESREAADLLAYAREEIARREREKAVRAVAQEVRARTQAGDFGAAFDRVQRAVAAFPGESELEFLLQATEAAKAKQARDEAIAEAVRRCQDLRQRQAYSEALRCVDVALAQFRDDPQLAGLREAIQREGQSRSAAASPAPQPEPQRPVVAGAEECDRLRRENKLIAASEKLAGLMRQFGPDPILLQVQRSIDEDWRGVRGALALSAKQEQGDQLQSALETIQTARAYYSEVPEIRIAAERLKAKIGSAEREKRIAEATAVVERSIVARNWDDALRAIEAGRGDFGADPAVAWLSERVDVARKNAEAAAASAEPAGFMGATQIFNPQPGSGFTPEPFRTASGAAARMQPAPAPVEAPMFEQPEQRRSKAVWIALAVLVIGIGAAAAALWVQYQRGVGASAGPPDALAAQQSPPVPPNPQARDAAAAEPHSPSPSNTAAPADDSRVPDAPTGPAAAPAKDPAATDAENAAAADAPAEGTPVEEPPAARKQQRKAAGDSAAGYQASNTQETRKRRASSDSDEDEDQGGAAPAAAEQAGAGDEKPYLGPPSVPVTWEGSLAPSAQLTLRDDSASEGRISGILPRHSGTVSVSPQEAQVVESPSAANGYRVVVRNNSDHALEVIKLVWRPAR